MHTKISCIISDPILAAQGYPRDILTSLEDVLGRPGESLGTSGSLVGRLEDTSELASKG